MHEAELGVGRHALGGEGSGPEFFASFDQRNGALVVKLDEAQVDELATG